MRIEDDELRELFKTTSAERIQNIDRGLLELESHPDNLDVIESILREAHSLKGDSNMLGQSDLGSLAHQMEHVLGSIQTGERTFDTDLGDRLSHALNAIRQLVNQAVTGEPAQITPFYILAELMGSMPTPPTAPPPSSSPLSPPHPLTPTSSPYRIETVRVPTPTLDTLMTEAGELTVTKIRIAHRLTEVDAIVNLWEEWHRDAFCHRSWFGNSAGDDKKTQQIQSFLQRAEAHIEELGCLANHLRQNLAEDITRLELISDDLEAGIRTLRLLPLSTIFDLFPRLVRDLARQEGKEIQLVLEGGDTRVDKRILEEMKDPLMHMLRNAIDHGIETPDERVRAGKSPQATLTLRGYQSGNAIVLEVQDDGRGLNVEAIKETALRRGLYSLEELEAMAPDQIYGLIFSPGFSTRLMVTEVSGRGVGLDVLRTNVERLKGHIEVNSEPGQGCTLQVQLGTTLATAHVLTVAVQDQVFALPVEWVEMARLVHPEEIFEVKGQPTIFHADQPMSVASLAQLLEMPEGNLATTSQPSRQTCIVLRLGRDRLGLIVDALLDEQDVVLKPQSQLLKRVRNIAGATILGSGEVCMVLNPQDLLLSVRQIHKTCPLPSSPSFPPALKKQSVVLLVEDSIATRTQEKRILEAAGYRVITAVDGVDGFNKLQMQLVDAVISDIQMPQLDGLGLTARIRQHREYNEIPVILVTTLSSDDDRRRGAEVGANAYIPKGSFNQDILLETLERLI